jgi:hypothetical protein
LHWTPVMTNILPTLKSPVNQQHKLLGCHQSTLHLQGWG